MLFHANGESFPGRHRSVADGRGLRPMRTGTTVAVRTGMTPEVPATPLTMTCPRCARPAVEAAADSSPVIAWFTCPACGCDWSARLRGGHPATVVDLPVTDLSLPQVGL
jgi:hypothetical protein